MKYVIDTSVDIKTYVHEADAGAAVRPPAGATSPGSLWSSSPPLRWTA
jgi:hypothetical protein